MAKYINVSAVKKLIQAHGKRPGKAFLFALDASVERRVISACEVHNGGKKTLDAAVAGHVGLK